MRAIQGYITTEFFFFGCQGFQNTSRYFVKFSGTLAWFQNWQRTVFAYSNVFSKENMLKPLHFYKKISTVGLKNQISL